MKVINLFGGPGTGKSATAGQLFAELKIKGKRCEYVQEFAKDLVYEQSFGTLADQEWIFANQHRRMNRYVLSNQTDLLVTDSPLFLSIVYSGKDKDHKEFHQYVMSVINRYDNLNIYLERSTVYQQEGRYQNEEDAKKVDDEILYLFDYFNINYVKVNLKNVSQNIISLL